MISATDMQATNAGTNIEQHSKSKSIEQTEFIPDEKDLDETSENEETMIANAISGDKIKQLLSASGPTVKSVLLKTDGTAVEVSLIQLLQKIMLLKYLVLLLAL